MIEIQCPACGADGRVPNDKTNTRLVCKKCLKVFHVTASGRSMLGEPPGTGITSTPASHVRATDPTAGVDQLFERLSRAFVAPKNLKLALVCVLLLAAAAYFLSRRGETLQQRADRVARAAVHGDLQAIRAMAASGQEEDVVKWYDAIRSQCDEFRQQLGSRGMNVAVQLKGQDPSQRLAEVLAQIETDEDLERRGAALPDPTITSAAVSRVRLPMVWREEPLSGWRLDGKLSHDMARISP